MPSCVTLPRHDRGIAMSKSWRWLPLLGLAAILWGEPAQAAPVVAGFERLHWKATDPSVKGGDLLLSELNCTSCHQSESAAKKQAPVLDNLGTRVRPAYLRKYLLDPHAEKPGTTMPHLFADDPDKEAKVEALVHFLATTGKLTQGRPDIKAVIRGRDLFSKVGCVACHGPRDINGEGAKFDVPYVVPLGNLKGKYGLPGLTAFLSNPLQIRPSGRMPHLLNSKDAIDVANYLLQGVKVSLPTGKGVTKYSYFEGDWGNIPDFSKMKPHATGTGVAFELAYAKRESNYGMRFEGVFSLNAAGAYTFHLNSDDGSILRIDDKKVVDNDGIHAPLSKSGTIELTKGVHKVTVDFIQGGGGAELSVEFEGRGLGRQPFGSFVGVTEADLEKKDEPKKGVEPEDDVIDIKPDLVAKGKSLFTSVGCANCHSMTEDKKTLASNLVASPLGKLKATGGCLSNKPVKGLPHYALSAKQQAALSAAISKPVVESKEPAAVITRTMLTMNCYACHARDKFGGPTEELNKFFTTTQPEMGDEARIPPPLDLVGAKLRPEYLKIILDKGNVPDKGPKDRPYMHTFMPGFGQQNVGHLAAAFAAVDKLPAIEKVTFDIPEAKVRAAGRHLLGAQAFSCIKCHTYAGNKAEGVQGIDMVLMPKRLQRDWVYAYLLDPQKIRPGTRMPTGWPEGVSTLATVLDGNTKQQIEAIWQYQSLGTSVPVPIGVGGSKFIPLNPTTEAIIYRNFIKGAGNRGIAVGYPEKVHLAFDANEMRIAMIWQGAFIDAGMHWTDRGSGSQGPLGDNVMNLHGGAPFAVLASRELAWPTQAPRDLGWRFNGYRTTPDERPTFLYSLDNIKVEDFPNPGKGKDPSLTRTINLSGGDKVENLYYRAIAGNKIEPADNGWYKVDGWKIKVEGDGKPFVRPAGGKSELLVPVTFKDGKAKLSVEYDW